MRGSDTPVRRTAAGAARLVLRLALVLVAFMLPSLPVAAHKASDSYLQVEETASGVAVRWDIALRDLDAALDLDADADGKLTWGEIRTAWPRIEAYARSGLRIQGCTLEPAGRGLERRTDGAYAVLRFTSPCHLSAPPIIAYTLFRAVDPTHRGIARIQQPGRALALAVLDPTHPPAIAEVPGATEAGSGTVARDTVAARDTGAGVDRGALTEWLGFAREGVRHILTGYDHVLFLLCLLLPAVMRRTPQGWRPVEHLSQAVWPVVGIVSAFTVAHSITLGLAATKTVSLSPAFIEPAIAVTIVLAALDNLRPVFPVRRVIVTFFFGLVHGFGFAGVLSELNLPTGRFAWALLQFNLGLEAGQLLIVVAVTGVLFLLRTLPRYPAWVIRGGSCAALLVGVVWFVERTANVTILGI